MSKKSEIGTDKYFEEIAKTGVFKGLRLSNSAPFTDRAKEISKNAATALKQIHTDLEKNKDVLWLAEQRDLRTVERFAAVLHETARFMGASVSKSSNDIKNTIKRYALPSKYSMREVQQLADHLVRHKLTKLSYKELQKTPLKVKSEELFNFAHKYNANKNRWGSRVSIGNRDYLKKLENFVLCGLNFSTPGNSRYAAEIKAHSVKLIKQIEKDLKEAVQKSQYMEAKGCKKVCQAFLKMSPLWAKKRT